MKQHALYDRIGALAVMHDLLEIGTQHIGQVFDISLRLRINRQAAHSVPQLSIVDEVERVLDFMGDTGGELTKRS